MWKELEFAHENVTPRFVARFNSTARTFNFRSKDVLSDLMYKNFLEENGSQSCDPFMTG